MPLDLKEFAVEIRTQLLPELKEAVQQEIDERLNTSQNATVIERLEKRINDMQQELQEILQWLRSQK